MASSNPPKRHTATAGRLQARAMLVHFCFSTAAEIFDVFQRLQSAKMSLGVLETCESDHCAVHALAASIGQATCQTSEASMGAVDSSSFPAFWIAVANFGPGSLSGILRGVSRSQYGF
eukprot:TRINITY_DN13922_c0_g1_i1.p2 TRINITY_DN13922_c0_g1~~TRINITY_DN13922_c0_g1_i1.p2  ORF type:complete len:118 (+),score=2.48 TRINITY_DN13922_c0_g1_i1:603-956(+)